MQNCLHFTITLTWVGPWKWHGYFSIWGFTGKYFSLVSQKCVYALLTHWGWDKMAAILQTTFSNLFSWMKMYEIRLKLHWSLFLQVQLTIFQHWFRWWLDAGQATNHYLIQWWLDYRRIYASLGLNELIPNTLVSISWVNACVECW